MTNWYTKSSDEKQSDRLLNAGELSSIARNIIRAVWARNELDKNWKYDEDQVLLMIQNEPALYEIATAYGDDNYWKILHEAIGAELEKMEESNINKRRKNSLQQVEQSNPETVLAHIVGAVRGKTWDEAKKNILASTPAGKSAGITYTPSDEQAE